MYVFKRMKWIDDWNKSPDKPQLVAPPPLQHHPLKSPAKTPQPEVVRHCRAICWQYTVTTKAQSMNQHQSIKQHGSSSVDLRKRAIFAPANLATFIVPNVQLRKMKEGGGAKFVNTGSVTFTSYMKEQ